MRATATRQLVDCLNKVTAPPNRTVDAIPTSPESEKHTTKYKRFPVIVWPLSRKQPHSIWTFLPRQVDNTNAKRTRTIRRGTELYCSRYKHTALIDTKPLHSYTFPKPMHTDLDPQDFLSPSGHQSPHQAFIDKPTAAPLPPLSGEFHPAHMPLRAFLLEFSAGKGFGRDSCGFCSCLRSLLLPG